MAGAARAGKTGKGETAVSLVRRCFGFLTVLALLLCALFLCLHDSVLDWVLVLSRGYGAREYQAASAGEDGILCAAGRTENGLRLTFFEQSGKRLAQWDAPLPEEARGGTLAGLYPLGTDTAFCGVYTPRSRALLVLSLTRGGGTACLLREPCPGETSAARREDTRLFPFSQDGGEVRFVVRTGRTLTAYAWSRERSGVRALSTLERERGSGAAVLPDGSIAAGGGDGTISGQRPAFLTRTGSGLYYVDAATLTLCYSDLTGSSVRELLPLDGVTGGHCLSSLAVTPQGGALALLDGRRLTLARRTGRVDLTGALYETRGRCVLYLALCALAALAAAWAVWHVLCGIVLKYRLPLLAQGGAMLLAAFLLAGLGLYRGVWLPEREREAAERRTDAIGPLVRLVLEEASPENPSFDARLEAALAEDGTELSLFCACRTGEHWTDRAGDRAELSPLFDGALAEEAALGGAAAARSGEVFRCAFARENWAVFLTLSRPAEGGGVLWRAVLLALAAVAGAGFLLLAAVSANARRLARAAEALSAGRAGKLRVRSGDELEGLAATLAGLGASAARRNREEEELVRAYRRFVPERVISLLGRRSIREVDKSTFALRRMAVMAVRFRFPERVYAGADNSRLLFDSVNEIIERTASIAAGMGGTAFNFAYNGYDVVLDDCPGLVSAAVAMAQEALSFNEGRARKGLPEAAFHVALDIGDVMLGVVGDETKLEPTTISTSFTTARELIRLCGRLQAGILCTESVISAAPEQASRYMGKCARGGASIRVYEIFSGDSYDLRRGKESTSARFSQGVLALYSGETARAKRIFLELAHRNSQDGGVRYYLYLADRMERDPDCACALE